MPVNTKNEQLDLIIIPHSDLVKLDLLKTTNWQMICNLTSITDETDIRDSLSEIKEYFGKDTNESTIKRNSR